MDRVDIRVKRQIESPLWQDVTGAALYSIGLYTFASEGGFAPGGISGLALIFYELFEIPIGIITLVLNIPLIILSKKHLGLPFLMRTVRVSLIASGFMDIILPIFPTFSASRLLSALMSGVLIGASLALFYRTGSSSGGIDLLLLSIRAKHPHLNIGGLMIAFDIPVILAGYLVYGDYEAVIFGSVASLTEAVFVSFFA